MKITIIGAGPVGCYTGYLLAEQGHKVTIIEEHETIGLPFQCTGIVSSEFADIIKIKRSFLKNTIKKARIYSPEHNYFELKFSKANYVLDRTKLDQHLARKAQKSGVKILTRHRFIGYDKDTSKAKVKELKTSKEKELKTDILIGADGPKSSVAKATGLIKNYNEVEYWTGMQARLKLDNANVVEFYPHHGSYSWVVPENKNIVRIGTVAEKDVAKCFQKFLEERIGSKQEVKARLIDKQAGLIPKYKHKRKLQSKDQQIFLVGDAAGQIKALTGGGLVPGLMGAEVLAISLHSPMSYQSLVKKILGPNMIINNLMRKALDNFSEKDYNDLIRRFNKPKVRAILENTERDFPLRYVFKLLIKQPGLLKYVSKVI